MNYNTLQFYNAALGIVAGAGAAALSFRLIPPLSPAFRTRRLLALTLRDLRRLAMGRGPNIWEGHIHARLSAMPDEATPLQRAYLLAAMSVGSEIIRLRHIAHRLGLSRNLDSALAAVAEGKSSIATARLMHFDEALARLAVPELEVVQGRSSVLTLFEALTKHAAYFNGEARR
jgi:uncharacterized membrane protein YccC